MKLIITGATGFIGQNLVRHFSEKGLEVAAMGRSGKLGSDGTGSGIQYTRADITDTGVVSRTFPDGDCVIHCAGKAGDWGRYGEFHAVNVVGTRNIIRACRDRGTPKLIFISTPSVYYNGRDRLGIRENDPLPRRQFPYGKTKLRAEQDLLAAEGLETIIFRPRAVYGPHDATILPRILAMSAKKRFPLINNGEALVDITYMGNLAAAVESALNAPDNAWNQVYNISNGDPIRIRDWFKMVLDIFDRPFRPKNIPVPLAATVAAFSELAAHLPVGNKTPSMTRFSVGYMARSLTMSIQKAGEQLGYAPPITNQQGFEHYKQWETRTAQNRTKDRNPVSAVPG